MKKRVLLLLLLIFTFPIKINALEYQSTLSGEDVLHAKSDNIPSFRTYTNLNIDVTNLDNISSFTMYVKYDKDLIGISNCSLFNYIGAGCSMTKDNKIYYHYQDTTGYSQYINKYNFYHVVFMPKDSTPDSGTTTVEVTFENAKDKDNNLITISPSSKTYTFSKPGFTMKIDENSSTKEATDSTDPITQETNNQKVDTTTSNNTTTEDKSHNNYAKEIKIENYELGFDKNKNDYSINIKKETNQLDVSVTLEDSNATYIVNGADNLQENNYQVFIEITSESGEKNIYKIKANIIDEEKNTDLAVKNLEKEESKSKENIFNKKNIIITLLIIFIILIMMLIISNRKNKKMDKMFKGL